MGGNVLKCGTCGAQERETVAHLGAFYYRCAKCGATIVATSLRAYLDGLPPEGRVEVRMDPRSDRSKSVEAICEVLGIGETEVVGRNPLLQGSLSELRPTVYAIAHRGIHLLLWLP